MEERGAKTCDKSPEADVNGEREKTRVGMRDETLEAIAVEKLFESDDAAFAVIVFERSSRAGESAYFTGVGAIAGIHPGETLSLQGRFQEHARHGKRFRVSSYTPILPSTEAGIERFLSSGLIPGVGPSRAKKIVERFGIKALEIAANQSVRLREIPGIGEALAQSIATVVRERRGEADALSFLHSLGLGPAQARALLERFGVSVAAKIRENPYRLMDELRGFGFITADKIAAGLGIERDDPRRVRSAALYLLGKAADSGHSFLHREELERDVEEYEITPALLDPAIKALVAAKLLIVEDDAVYPPPLFFAERVVAAKLAQLAAARPRARGLERADPIIARSGLSPAQKSAVELSLREGLFILTGGPGTGKTTTVRAIVEAHEALDRRVLLAAPTGRAAKRMSEATDREAKTIHRLLEWNPLTGRFNRDAENPLDAETLLIDEASMLDLRLGERLLDAIPGSTTVIFIGDIDQLPPIAPGQVLRAMITSERVAKVELREVFRQAEASAIVRGAHQVLRAEPPSSSPPGATGSGDLFVIHAHEVDHALGVLKATLRRMREVYAIDPETGCQVLSPMRRGPLGVNALNELLREELNPSDGGAELFGMRVGDKVMQLKNDYERDIYNGDLGFVRRAEAGRIFVDFDGREVQLGPDQLDALSLAYASTVHKVQGSEFEAVIILLHPGHYLLLDRAMLYTALTRAKRLAVLIGDRQSIEMAVRSARAREVNGRLALRLIEAVDQLGAEAARPS